MKIISLPILPSRCYDSRRRWIEQRLNEGMILVKKRSLTAALALFIWLLVSVGAGAGDYRIYENTRFDFSLEYPADWVIREDFMGILFVALAPLEDAADLFQENINVGAEDIGDMQVGLAAYHALGLRELENYITGFNLLISDEAIIAGRAAKIAIFSGRQGDLDLKWLQGQVLHRGLAYTITYTAEPAKFDKYLPAVLSVFNSFRFLAQSI